MKLKFNIHVFVLFIVIGAGCKLLSNNTYIDIDPPFPSLSIAPDTAIIEPAAEQTVHFKNGISIEVPANAFTDERGNPVTKPVRLSVTMYDTKAKILASGIPMKYSENGQTHDFESAGMFNIEGYCGADKVQIGKGKKLSVNFPSKTKGDYDFYYLDEKATARIASAGFGSADKEASDKRKGRWTKLSADKAAISFDTSKTLKNFKLKFDAKDYPDMAELETINWHLATSFRDPTTNSNSWALEKEWSSLDISKPKYIVDDEIYTFPFTSWTATASPNNLNAFLDADELVMSPDEKKAIITNKQKKTLLIWSGIDKKAVAINNVADFQPVQCIDSNYLLIRKQEGECMYNYSGTLLANYGNTMDEHFLPAKKRIVYYYTPEKFFNNGASIRLADFSGKVIKEFKEPDETFHSFVLTDDKLFIDSAGVAFEYDLDGKLIKSLAGGFSSLGDMENDKLLCEKENGRLVVWDYKNNRSIESKAEDFDIRDKTVGNSSYGSHTRAIAGKPYVIIDEASNRNDAPSKVWNYQTNEVFTLGFHAEPVEVFTELVIQSHHSDSLIAYQLYDLDKRRTLAMLSGSPQEEAVRLMSSKKWNRILVPFYGGMKLLDRNARVVRDFTKFDSSIMNIGFVDSNRLYSYSNNGLYRTWDMNGKLLSTVVIENGQNSYGGVWNNELVIWDNIFRTYKIYDVNGTLLIDAGRQPMGLFEGHKYVINMLQKNTAGIAPYQERGKDVYQLTLRTSTDEFQTYVFIDEATMQKIIRYTGFKTMKLNEEVGRQAMETGLLRRFEIEKFGVYNWDRLLFAENNIGFAAKFRFDTPVEYSNITIFLLTSIDGNAVIKFPFDTWDKFYIDPTKSNKLIAVLPGNKIAVFSEEEMKKVDWEKVKQNHSFSFNMNTIDQTMDSLAMLNRYL